MREPSLSCRPGFSLPGSPNRISFIMRISPEFPVSPIADDGNERLKIQYQHMIVYCPFMDNQPGPVKWGNLESDQTDVFIRCLSQLVPRRHSANSIVAAPRTSRANAHETSIR